MTTNAIDRTPSRNLRKVHNFDKLKQRLNKHQLERKLVEKKIRMLNAELDGMPEGSGRTARLKVLTAWQQAGEYHFNQERMITSEIERMKRR